MGMIVGILIRAAWLWFVMVLFTKRHEYDWKEMLLWVALEGFISAGVLLLFMKSLDSPVVYASAIAVSMVLRSFYLYLVLTFRFQVGGSTTKFSIIGVYIGVRILISLLLGFAGGSTLWRI